MQKKQTMLAKVIYRHRAMSRKTSEGSVKKSFLFELLLEASLKDFSWQTSVLRVNRT